MTKRIKAVHCFIIFVFGILIFKANAQSPLEEVNDTLVHDDLGIIADRFQELFFDALAKRAAEDYEKSNQLLLASTEFAAEEPAVYFLLSKNYLQLEELDRAAEYANKALEKKPGDREISYLLFEIYGRQNKHAKTIAIAESLVKYDNTLYEDLARLHFLNKDEQAALENLDHYVQRLGEEESILKLRQRILRDSENKDQLILHLKNAVSKNPLNPQNYKDLIYLHYFLNRGEEAYKNAISLQKLEPEATEVPLGQFQYFLENQNEEMGVQAMKSLISDKTIAEAIKMNIISVFSQFVQKHPEYETDFIEALGEELNEGTQSNRQIGEQYLGRDNRKALSYFEKALRETPQDYQLIIQTLTVQLQLEEYEAAAERSETALLYFPTQALLYYYKGKAENKRANFAAAADYLKDGLEFVMDEREVLEKLYEELIYSSKNLGKTAEVEHYQKKLKAIRQ